MLLKNNVLRLFLERPTKEFHLREIAAKAGVSTTAATRTTKELASEGIINAGKRGIYKIFSADRESESYRQLKLYFTMSRILESGLLDFLEEFSMHPETIILFGSSAKGLDTEKSDIDIFILSPVSQETDLERFEKILGKSVQILVMSRKEFESAKKKNPEIINNIANGILLRGYLKVI